MPAPKKPVPRAILDSALIDDGWALPGEFDLPRPQERVAQPAAQRATDDQPKRTAPRHARLEDWFDEVDLGWCLPGEGASSELPPSPLHIEFAAPPELVVVSTETDEPAEDVEASEPLPSKLDLNAATSEELLRLPGVGHKKAGAILAWRKKHGRFAELADLTGVSGFGAKTVDKLSAHLTVHDAIDS